MEAAQIEAGIIGVLHSLSLLTTPPRILRAARFEARLGFSRIDERSEALIAGQSLLDRISGGERIRHELDLIFRRPSPDAAIASMHWGCSRCSGAGWRDHGWPSVFAACGETFTGALWEISTPDEWRLLHWAVFYTASWSCVQQAAEATQTSNPPRRVALGTGSRQKALAVVAKPIGRASSPDVSIHSIS